MNLIILFCLIKIVFNGIPVAELKIDEETESECYNTENPQSVDDCIDREIDEEDTFCCLFEIETLRKEKKKRCAGLTQFQYDHIKLYVKEKMDQLLYRDLNIYCDSTLITKERFLIVFTLFLFLLL